MIWYKKHLKNAPFSIFRNQNKEMYKEFNKILQSLYNMLPLTTNALFKTY